MRRSKGMVVTAFLSPLHSFFPLPSFSFAAFYATTRNEEMPVVPIYFFLILLLLLLLDWLVRYVFFFSAFVSPFLLPGVSRIAPGGQKEGRFCSTGPMLAFVEQPAGHFLTREKKALTWRRKKKNK